MIQPPYATRDIYDTHGHVHIRACQSIAVHPCSDPGFVIVAATGRSADGYEIKVPMEYVGAEREQVKL